jgi:hypothetical protein
MDHNGRGVANLWEESKVYSDDLQRQAKAQGKSNLACIAESQKHQIHNVSKEQTNGADIQKRIG